MVGYIVWRRTTRGMPVNPCAIRNPTGIDNILVVRTAVDVDSNDGSVVVVAAAFIVGPVVDGGTAVAQM